VDDDVDPRVGGGGDDRLGVELHPVVLAVDQYLDVIEAVVARPRDRRFEAHPVPGDEAGPDVHVRTTVVVDKTPV
jgi:hypothetical protein